jgi:hypothetical protein
MNLSDHLWVGRRVSGIFRHTEPPNPTKFSATICGIVANADGYVQTIIAKKHWKNRGFVNGGEQWRTSFWRRECPPNPQQVCLFTKHLEIERGACPQIDMQTDFVPRAPCRSGKRAGFNIFDAKQLKLSDPSFSGLSKSITSPVKRQVCPVCVAQSGERRYVVKIEHPARGLA